VKNTRSVVACTGTSATVSPLTQLGVLIGQIAEAPGQKKSWRM